MVLQHIAETTGTRDMVPQLARMLLRKEQPSYLMEAEFSFLYHLWLRTTLEAGESSTPPPLVLPELREKVPEKIQKLSTENVEAWTLFQRLFTLTPDEIAADRMRRKEPDKTARLPRYYAGKSDRADFWRLVCDLLTGDREVVPEDLLAWHFDGGIGGSHSVLAEALFIASVKSGQMSQAARRILRYDPFLFHSVSFHGELFRFLNVCGIGSRKVCMGALVSADSEMGLSGNNRRRAALHLLLANASVDDEIRPVLEQDVSRLLVPNSTMPRRWWFFLPNQMRGLTAARGLPRGTSVLTIIAGIISVGENRSVPTFLIHCVRNWCSLSSNKCALMGRFWTPSESSIGWSLRTALLPRLCCALSSTIRWKRSLVPRFSRLANWENPLCVPCASALPLSSTCQ